MDRVLRALGVTDDMPTEAERAHLDEDGFVLLPGILTPSQIVAMNARLEELGRIEGDEAGKEAHQEVGAMRLGDLINKGPMCDLCMFDICWTHPRVPACMRHVLNAPFRVYSLNGRFALPGSGRQAFHEDWAPADPDERRQVREEGAYFVCNSIWLLADFTEKNGAIWVVPGSHRGGVGPVGAMADAWVSHPNERSLLGPAGSVVVFNSHLWHAGTENLSSRPRRAMHSSYARRAIPQQTDQRRYLRPETEARLDEARRWLLDV